MPTTFNVVSLGQYADIDTNESAVGTENASALVGLTFGGVGDSLVDDFVSLSPVGSTGGGYDNQNNPDWFSINGGAAQRFDSSVTYNATVTYSDGTTATITAVVFQDTNGNTYLAPETSSNSDQSALEGKAIRSLTIDSVADSSVTGMGTNRETWDYVICFVKGTEILTASGTKRVEDLVVGDCVATRDGGMKPIRWVGSRPLDSIDLAVNPKLHPVRIAAGALGPQNPARDLLVSRQHRVLLRSGIVKRMFDHDEVLVPAVKLVGAEGIEIATDVKNVEYFHILFDNHEVICSNGAWTESLFTGPEALKAVSPCARTEIETLFPEICDPQFEPVAARYIPQKGKVVRRLVERHQKNAKPLYNVA